MVDLNKFIEYQKEHPYCHVRIDIGEIPGTNMINIWVYDYNLMIGQHVNSVEEIDLQTKKDKEDKKKLEELKKKFGEV